MLPVWFGFVYEDHCEGIHPVLISEPDNCECVLRSPNAIFPHPEDPPNCCLDTAQVQVGTKIVLLGHSHQ